MLKDINEWMFGDFRANRQRTEERHAMDMKRMQSLLDSAAGQQLLAKARSASLDRGEGLYGGGRSTGVDHYVQGAEDLGKIRAARDKFSDDEMSPETAVYFDLAEKSVLNRMNRGKKAEDRTDFVGPPASTRKPRQLGKPKVPTSKSAAEYFQPLKHDRFEGSLPPTDEGMFDRFNEYFQAPTETVPEGNIPKTYQQLGISSVDEQATLQEMQNALPDRDMRQEYESDPEYMEKLIRLWKEGKLNKSNLHKAFSALQQRAQKSLGIA